MDIFNQHGLTGGPVLLLAPMEGITNGHFRDLICQIGCVDLVATEFVRITGSRQKVRSFHRHDSFGVPLQIQLMGTDAQVLSQCILHLKSRRVISDADWIDLNVGCPSKRVNASGAGAALLLEPTRLNEILLAMRAVHPGPLSVKTRLGFNSEEEFPKILDHLKLSPIDFITLHARARCARHDGPICTDLIALAVEELPFPVIANGDVRTPTDAQAMLSLTGARGIMCGRGVVMNPFLFQDIRNMADNHSLKDDDRPESVAARLKNIEIFVDALISRYSESESESGRSCSGVFKEFAGWLSKNPLIGREFFQAIKRVQNTGDFRQICSDYFRERLKQHHASEQPSKNHSAIKTESFQFAPAES